MPSKQRRWIEVPDVELPLTEVDAYPRVGIYLNIEWKKALLSLVQHADQKQFWLTNESQDVVEQQAYELFRLIRKATGMIGMIFPYVSELPPAGTLPCDGQLYNYKPQIYKAGQLYQLPTHDQRTALVDKNGWF
jgi:hypothetical protein